MPEECAAMRTHALTPTQLHAPQAFSQFLGDNIILNPANSSDESIHDPINVFILQLIQFCSFGVGDPQPQAVSAGDAFFERYERLRELDDLDNAITAYRDALPLTLASPTFTWNPFKQFGELLEENRPALEVTVANDPDLKLRPNGRSVSSDTRSEDEGNLAGLETVILWAIYCYAWIMPQDTPGLAVFVTDLAFYLQNRFRRLGKLSNLERAIESVRKNISVSSRLLNNLAISQRARFNQSDSLDDTISAVDAHEQALALTVGDDIELYRRRLNDLDVTLGARLKRARSDRARFGRQYNEGDLERILEIRKQIVSLTTVDNPELPQLLGSLARSFLSRFVRQGYDLDALDDAIDAGHRSVELALEGNPDLPRLLDGLNQSLWIRFEIQEDLGDLENVLLNCHRAVQLTPEDDPYLHHLLHQLSASIRTRYNLLGELNDLERHLEVCHQLVKFTSEDDSDLPERLDILANALHSRFKRLKDINDLEAALQIQQRVVQLTPDDYYDLPRRLDRLASFLVARSERLGNLDDLETSIQMRRRVLKLALPDDPMVPQWLESCAFSYGRRFNRLRELPDLEMSIEKRRQAIRLSFDQGPRPIDPEMLGNLVGALKARYMILGEIKDIQEALEVGHRALDLTPDGHAIRPRLLYLLGVSHHAQLLHDGTKKSFNWAFKYYMDATKTPLGEPFVRHQAAGRCLHMLQCFPDYSSQDTILLAHSRILGILPELVWLGHSIQRRFRESMVYSAEDLVNQAVRDAIRYQDYHRALEWLEEGRCLIWSQVATTRTPLDDLEEKLPELTRKMREAYQGLQWSGLGAHPDVSSRVSTVAPGMRTSILGSYSVDSAADRNRKAAISYESLLAEIRSHDGFEDFMRPKKLNSFTSSPAFASLSGPVVFFNAGKVCYDALILLCTGEMRSVKLPQLTIKRVEKLHSRWTKHVGLCRAHRRALVPREMNIRGGANIYGNMLGRLWTWGIHPILQTLGFTQKISDGDLPPHVIWCPTGLLTQLPLHAAGIYDAQGSGPHVYDFVVSSTTPSLSAQLRCYEVDGNLHPNPSMLLVAQPDTPRKGLSRLPHVRAEAARIRALLPGDKHTVLESEQATVDLVLDVLDQHTWVHFACHGSQNRDDPTESAFELYDGRLTLSALMDRASTNAELAFLSACETAVGDPKIPEESAHLAAGMLAVGFKGVVATMWSIWDKDGPVIVEAYYKRLLELRESGTLKKGETGAAYALHDAVKCLREEVGENNFERWVPFVHFGA